ncbi:2-C-methyl-D-erythritol 4-phosphate cytidylyltransferase [Nitrosomonas sp. PY1]|uniref:2-C-methyl-D-erythritol 4-phosphate cytidylyltransferase n=1 Tax=Nitrosomonas sp. PY1 TaxID=1803906 RepID=UPI001FC87617|nr:2-C-methyl-D-erythritol 4-phosphate cytidylyltransferase [Nitrosomonas sp. PY1]GKS68233.1 2-C-methyl-D-erythritol 4-phosphate cytidylyltransferase [Nitrosomonas sp. PY1]
MTQFNALIPAAGSGSRMGNTLPKQYLQLNNHPMIYHAIKTLCSNQTLSKVFVVLSPTDHDWYNYDWSEFSTKLTVLNCGGATRSESVRNGLLAMKQKNAVEPHDWILVHDAARPCLTTVQLDNLIEQVREDPVGGLLAVPVADTLKRGDAENRVIRTESRDNIWQAQTPQMFRHGLLAQALQQTAGEFVTDEASAIEAIGLCPKLVIGDSYNFKVTYSHDLALAELIIHKRSYA